MINVGGFKHRVQLQRRAAATKDSRGNLVPGEWETVIETRAAIRDVSAREFYDAAVHQMEHTVTFTLRWRDGITNDMRLLFQGDPYEILQVNHLGYRRDFLAIKAKLTQGEVQRGDI